MSDDKDPTFTLKAVINKQKTKVLFVEIENDLANVLLGFMTLPLGRIVQVLRNHYGERTPAIGSLNTLYNSVANLDSSHFQSYDKKQMLLTPKSTYSSPFQKINLCLFDPEPTDFYPDTTFIEYSASFIVSDNLWMMDNVSQPFVECLQYVDVAMEDLDEAETRTVMFGVSEIMDLLKGSLISRLPLTDIILGTKQTKRVKPTPEKSESESEISLRDLFETEATCDSKDMLVSLIFEKPSKKFLFAQAGQDFVDLLFSMLVIPLGVVECLSGTVHKNINNMRCSIESTDGKVFGGSSQDLLLGNINPHSEESLFTSQVVQTPIIVDSRSRMFIISDDLCVTPFSVSSTLSLLRQMKISVSDVEELDLDIGLKEVKDSSILYVSLKSTCALSKALINILLTRRQRKECLQQRITLK